jgi:hypothetical protein
VVLAFLSGALVGAAALTAWTRRRTRTGVMNLE